MAPHACSRRARATSMRFRFIPSLRAPLYQVYAAPGEITDIALESGEQLVGAGPVAAGDTVRWIIGDTESGVAATKRVSYPGQTDTARFDHQPDHQHRPAYLPSRIAVGREDLHGFGLLGLRAGPAHCVATPECRRGTRGAGCKPASTSTRSISATGSKAIRLPGGRYAPSMTDVRWFVEFPSGIGQGEMPPLWVIGPEGGAELVNYRVQGNHMIIDRLFAAAELRLGGEHQKKVRIVRTDGRPQS